MPACLNADMNDIRFYCLGWVLEEAEAELEIEIVTISE